MKTANNLLHTQLVELFEQYPCITCFSHDEEGVYFLHGEAFLHIHYNQIETIVSEADKVIITLGNEAIYTVTLSQDSVRITLPKIEE